MPDEDGNIDPPWRLDPTINIINVNWGDPYKLAGVIFGQKGDPTWVMQFAKPKAFYTEAEIDAKKVPTPTFGSSIDLPTPTASNNQITSFGGFSGNSLVCPPPDFNIDWRGYIEVTGQILYKAVFDNGTFAWGPRFPASGEKLYFDYKGNPISKDQIPKDTFRKKGLAIASDGEGTVYMLDRDGLTKYDKDGGQLWKIDHPFIGAAHYDSKRRQIVATDGGSILRYGLDGSKQGEKILPAGDGDVSRKGKVYGFEAFNPEGETFEGILGYNANGEQIFKIPGENFADGAQFGVITAYGEDYLIVTTSTGTGAFDEIHTPQIGETPGVDAQSSGTHNGYRVYDANNGALINDTHWEDDIRRITLSSSIITFEQDDVLSYGFCRGFIRSPYFPEKES